MLPLVSKYASAAFFNLRSGESWGSTISMSNLGLIMFFVFKGYVTIIIDLLIAQLTNPAAYYSTFYDWFSNDKQYITFPHRPFKCNLI